MSAVVSGHLGDSIREGRLKSALHATLGGPGEGFTTDELLGHWLDIAIARGSHFAADAFLTGISTPVRYQQMALLRNLRLDHEITIAEGVRIVPHAESHASLPAYLPLRLEPKDLPGWTDLRLADFIHGSIVIVDALVSPTFIDPAEKLGIVIPPYYAGVFEYGHVSNESGSFNVDKFCDALSLVIGGGVVIQSPAKWLHLDDDHLCRVGVPLFVGPSMTSRRNRDSRLFDASEEIILSATNLYRTRMNLNRRTAARLNIAIDRWLRSYEDMLLVDKFIDLGISLEILYLDGIRDELKFRLALNAAWHLGGDVPSRESLMRDFRKVYDLRSKAVHTGSVENTDQVRAVLMRAQEYCRWAIVSIISEGRFPDWNKLVLG